MTVRNLFLSLVLSLVLTFVITVLYVFYPVWSLILSSMFRSMSSPNTHSDGIAAVAGGVSGSFLQVGVVMALASFLLIFTFLQRRSRR